MFEEVPLSLVSRLFMTLLRKADCICNGIALAPVFVASRLGSAIVADQVTTRMLGC